MTPAFERLSFAIGLVVSPVLLFGCASAVPVVRVPDPLSVQREAAHELDDFHAAAAAADEERYFAHFAPRGVFLGTDPTERWDVPAFRAYAHAHFASGTGWTYEPGRRAIESAPGGDVVWFDEDLKNAHLGHARGTGVLVRVNGRLRIAQYNLTVPIPNAEMDAALRAVEEGAHPPPPMDLEAHYKKAYATATSDAAFEPLEEAAKALEGVLAEAKKHPEVDTEFWLHNELTWIRWQQAYLGRALEEVDAAKGVLDRGTFSDAKRTALRLHALWDDAYLLLEVAMKAPSDQRKRLLNSARVAKAEYDALAAENHDNDGMAVLEAFFLTKTGKGRDAAAAAHRVDVEKDGNLQDLYVLAHAFDANGEHALADAAIARICNGNAYLMKPLILAQLVREGRRCGAALTH